MFILKDCMKLFVQVIPSGLVLSFCWFVAMFFDKGHGGIALGWEAYRYNMLYSLMMGFGFSLIVYGWLCITWIKERKHGRSVLRWGTPIQMFNSLNPGCAPIDGNGDYVDYSPSFIWAGSLLLLLGTCLVISIPFSLAYAIAGTLWNPHDAHFEMFWRGVVLFRWGSCLLFMGMFLALLPIFLNRRRKKSTKVVFIRIAVAFMLIAGGVLLSCGTVIQLNHGTEVSATVFTVNPADKGKNHHR